MEGEIQRLGGDQRHVVHPVLGQPARQFPGMLLHGRLIALPQRFGPQGEAFSGFQIFERRRSVPGKVALGGIEDVKVVAVTSL